MDCDVLVVASRFPKPISNPLRLIMRTSLCYRLIIIAFTRGLHGRHKTFHSLDREFPSPQRVIYIDLKKYRALRTNLDGLF